MGFSQALSGLNSAATNLDVIGNNIANSQTVGFKTSRTLFADVFAGAQAGLGTRVTAVLQDFSTGTLESTNRNLDLAISGGGFFRMIQNDQVVYSRNGQLSLANDGFLVNAQGARLTGFPAQFDANGDPITAANGGGDPVEMEIPSGALPAKPTSTMSAVFNLDGRVAPPAAAFSSADANTYSYANNVTVYDSQGNAHNTTMYFVKTSANNWNLHMEAEGATATTPSAISLEFNENGILIDPAGGATNVEFTLDGSVLDLDIALNLAGTTQFGNNFELSTATQNGFASGSLVGIAIDDAGNIVGNYSNEQSKRFGTIALANFANAEGLKSIGDNVWIETTGSGQALLGMAGTGKYGTIEAGVVENSNVDLTRELVNLIIAQRSYQANAQTIKVQDEVLQNAVNL